MVGLTSNNLMNLSMAERFDKFKEKGFGSVMIWLGPDAKESADERATLAERAGLFIENFHLSCDHLNEMWIDCKEGDERISRFKDEIAAASKHGVKTVVCHLTHGDFPPFVSTIGTNRIEDLVKFAENANVKLAFENVITKDHVTYVLENFKSPYVGLCYDVGHDHYWRVQDWLGFSATGFSPCTCTTISPIRIPISYPLTAASTGSTRCPALRKRVTAARLRLKRRTPPTFTTPRPINIWNTR